MKKLLAILSIFLLLGLYSCDLIDQIDGEESNELSGETNIDLSKPGNTYSVSVVIGEQYVDLKDSVVITKREDGIVTVKIMIETKGQPLAALIPAELKDANGNVNTEIKFKATSEGIQEFYNSGGDLSKPFTIIKYDWGVGEKWEFTKANGTKLTREITEKTGKDDFPMGFMYIKTTLIEQNSDIDGVKKIYFRANHRFGLVYMEYELDDGTKIKVHTTPLGDL